MTIPIKTHRTRVAHATTGPGNRASTCAGEAGGRSRAAAGGRRRGFTLVELLVVIAIIAVLAMLVFAVSQRIRKRAEAARITSSMRQMATLMADYASDNRNRLPPPRADIPEEGGKWGQLHWFEALAALLYPSLEPAAWRREDWWTANKPILLHPRCDKNTKPAAWAWWNPGYAISRQIVINLAPPGIGTSWTAGKNGPQTYGIPLSAIPEPSRTPIVAPRGDWHFTYDANEIKEPGLQQFLIDGKMPILFIDGHVEVMTLTEYQQRKLVEMPRK
jgi:prepilin-type N-terminal cleavage/methylation domain-containing protein/prepilin-type processing-associated H-X9-DG protein